MIKKTVKLSLLVSILFLQSSSHLFAMDNDDTWGDGTPKDPYALPKNTKNTKLAPAPKEPAQYPANTWGDGTPKVPGAPPKNTH